jgi:hypothetical protein
MFYVYLPMIGEVLAITKCNFNSSSRKWTNNGTRGCKNPTKTITLLAISYYLPKKYS